MEIPHEVARLFTAQHFAIVATVGMFFPRTRPSSTGVLIIVAAAWIACHRVPASNR